MSLIVDMERLMAAPSTEAAFERRLAPMQDSDSANEENSILREGARSLERFLQKKFGKSENLDDIVSNSCLRFIEARREFLEPIIWPQAYLRRTATNLFFDQFRRQQRSVISRHVSIDEHPADGHSLCSQLEARDMLRRIDAAMLQLRPRTREVFMARRVEGLSYAEIRAQLGVSFKVIEKEMARAIAHINRAVGRE